MRTHAFRAMSTEWWLGACDDADLGAAESLVREAEARYSRFRPDSLLAELNRVREVHDQELADLLQTALRLTLVTSGAFDVGIGRAINAAGYDRSFELLGRTGTAARIVLRRRDAVTVQVTDDVIRLMGDGTVDLGGIAKGWTVDRVATAFEQSGCHDYLVDGGGDIRVAGHDERGDPWTVGVAEGLAVQMEQGAICTSSTRKRRWRSAGEDAHHIIDPDIGAPSRGSAVEAVVIAPRAATADALATALIAAPDRGLAGLRPMAASALLLRDGRWEMTEGVDRWLV